MTTVARTHDVLAQVRTALQADAKEAAGNAVLSRDEQASLAPGVLLEAAEALRCTTGSGARVSVNALVDKAVADVERLFAQVNQASGAGAATVSQAEVRALAAHNPDAGQRLAKAYELITGKKIALDDVTPVAPVTPGPPSPAATLGNLNELHPRAFAAVEAYLNARSGGNGVFNAQERAALPQDFIKDAAYDTPPPRSAFNVANHLFSQELATILTDCGVRMVDLGRLDDAGTGLLQVPFTAEHLKQLLARHPEAAGLFADAIAATTGTRPELPGLPAARFVDAAPPTPAPGDRLVIAGVSLTTPSTSPYKITATLVDAHTLELKGPSVQDGDLRIALPGRQIAVALGADPVPKFMVLEALRRAAPDLDVRVVDNARGKMRIELWPAGSAPRGVPAPLSGSYVSPDPARPSGIDFKRSGETGFNSWNADTIAGEKLAIDVEGTRYEVVADASTPKVVDLFRALAARVRADGWHVEVKDYSPNVYCALKFVMP